MLGLTAILVGGVGITAQTSINARLRLALGSPFLSSFVSFLVGLGTLMLISLLVTGELIPFAKASGRPVWIWTGGIFGVIFLTMNILMVPRLGALQTALFPMAGQVLMSPVIDHFGLFDAPVHHMNLIRLLGIALVLIGAGGVVYANGLSVSRLAPGSGLGSNHSSSAELNFWRVAGFIAGMLSASQTAVNGRLGQILGSAWQASVANFATGVATLLVLNLALRTWRQLQDAPLSTGEGLSSAGPWWMWTGGILGALFVALNAYFAPILGAGATVLAGLAGMTIGSLLIDHFGLIGNARRRIMPLHVFMIALLLLGVLCVRVLG